MLSRVQNKFHRIRKSVLSFIEDYYTYRFLIKKGIETEFGFVKMYGKPIIQKYPGSRIILGRGVTLVSRSKNNIAGINHQIIISTLSAKAIIEIGKVGISGATICAAIGIKIGDYSGLGANSKIYDTDFHCIDPIKRRNQKSIEEALCEPIIIENDVWISSDVTILKGVTIKENSIVGAGAVVTKSIPANSIAAGNPAKVIKTIN